MSKCFNIFGASDYFGGYVKKADDVIICADGGLKTVKKLGLVPDYIIGDFDSGKKPDSGDYILLPKEKDDTDMLAAIRLALSYGAGEIHIWGGTGGAREEHTLANLQCLAYLSSLSVKAFLHGKDITVTAITNSSISLPLNKNGYVSVFSHTDKSEGVSIQGLKYSLENATLTNTFPIGISNEYISKEAVISVKCGTLLIYY